MMGVVAQEGHVIVRQGDPGDKFYIVEEGRCVALKSFVPGQTPKEVKPQLASMNLLGVGRTVDRERGPSVVMSEFWLLCSSCIRCGSGLID